MNGKKFFLVVNSIMLASFWALPLGGFLFGFTHADPPGVLSGLLVGIAFAVLTPTCMGFPPQNEGGVGEPQNAWPYIAVAFLLILCIQLLFWLRCRRVEVQYPSQEP